MTKNGLFWSYIPRVAKRWRLAPRPSFTFNEQRMCKDPTLSPIEHFWLMQMLGNFGTKRNFIILYFLIPSLPKIVSAPLRGLIFSDATNKFSLFSKKLEYCSQHTVLHYECYHCQTKFSTHLIYLSSISKFSNYRQNMSYYRQSTRMY